ncbi:MAG: LytR C-terminal domain-containing protein [FCB group bacterium]|jgi:P pilus assembly chaperone PapD
MVEFLKKLDKRSLSYTIILGVLLIAVSLMLSSFVFRMMMSQPVESKVVLQNQKGKVETTIQINILNGSGINGIAKKLKEYFRQRGFDVVEIGNYSKLVDKTQIIDRLGDKESSLKVANALGVEQTKVQTEIDSTLFVRCSIILGKDYGQLKMFK